MASIFDESSLPPPRPPRENRRRHHCISSQKSLCANAAATDAMQRPSAIDCDTLCKHVSLDGALFPSLLLAFHPAPGSTASATASATTAVATFFVTAVIITR